MGHYHCVVWIDHREAHVIQFDPDNAEASIVHPKSKHEHLHHKHGAVGSGRTPENHAYYQAVADAIKDAGEVLIVGPSTAKLELFKHLQAHAPAIAARVVSVETVDHPSEGRIRRTRRANIFSGGARPVEKHAPRLGEHTREVLAEAGYGQAEIDAMLGDGAAS